MHSTPFAFLAFWGRWRWAAALAAAALAGCAALVVAPPEEQVRDNSTRRWAALLADDFAEAYKFMSPAQRAVVTSRQYERRFVGAVTWLSAKVQKVDCEPQRCAASVELRYRANLPGHSRNEITTYIDEVWILDGGKWWIVESL